MTTRDIIINNTTFQGIEIPLPNAVLVMVAGPKGYVMCGYLDLATAEKLGDCAAIVRGIKTVDDLLKSPVVAATSHARKLGILPGMTGKEALSKLA